MGEKKTTGSYGWMSWWVGEKKAVGTSCWKLWVGGWDVPMQRMAFKPEERTLWSLAFTIASESLKIARRSECPHSTHCAPTLLIMGKEVAPVYAPLSSVYRSWAPNHTWK